MDVKKELRKEIEASLINQKNKTKQLEEDLKKSKEKEIEIANQLNCDHEWKTDESIMGGCNIDTCKKCKVSWYY